MTYIALLRGINVGPTKRMKMPDLIALATGLCFQEVKTYLQSGNLVANAILDASGVKKALESAIHKKFGFEVSVIVRTAKDIVSVIKKNPFGKKAKTENLYVTFLEDKPSNLPGDMKKASGEDYIIAGKEVYVHCPDGYGRTKLNNQAFEKALGVTATTRNWSTVLALADLSEKY